jgi:putative oxidoreductase
MGTGSFGIAAMGASSQFVIPVSSRPSTNHEQADALGSKLPRPTQAKRIAQLAQGRVRQGDRDFGEKTMTREAVQFSWKTVAILVGRLIFAAIFMMAATFKFMNMNGTASYIASAGLPFPLLLAWLAVLFESALILCFLTGAYFSEAALLAAFYVLFLGFTFHGPARWAGDQSEFGFFVDHFTFLAGLLFAAAHGPGRFLAMNLGFVTRA